MSGRNRPEAEERAPQVPTQVLFIHIPKTAGTTFTAVLDRQFEAEEICPAYYWRELLQIPRRELLGYSLIRGHFDYSVTELLRDVRVITMLRDPVARTLSHYRYMASLDHHPLREVYAALPLPDVLEDPELSRNMANLQTALIGRDSDLEQMRRQLAQEAPPIYPWENRPGARSPSLARARERLSTVAFVGLQERFDDSLMLLADTFGWSPPEGVARLNATPEVEQGSPVSSEWIAAARQANPLDMELYEIAADLFEERFLAMKKRAAIALGRQPTTVGRAELLQYIGSRRRLGDD